MEKATRHNTGKPQLSYILSAPKALEQLAARFEAGAEKYDRDNWKKGLIKEEVIDSLMRHLAAYFNGERVDEDGLTNVSGILWNAFVLTEFEMNGAYDAQDKL